MRRQFTALRMHWGKGCEARSPRGDPRTKTSEEGWLIAEQTVAKTGTGGETKYYFSNLPAKTSLKELATAVRSRWPTLDSSTRTRSSSAAWATSRGDAGMDYIAISRSRVLSYSFLALTRWQAKSSSTAPTLPEVHRQVLLALLTDLVQRWAQMRQPVLSAPFAHLLDRAPPKKIQPLTK